ncbi:ribosome-inactivating family protein [Streptomyces bottropensis]|uniref:Ribosome-inactivating family protein n=1 Tax=Streptomyces bottropensis TaxID=42235 RepID=A0ABU8B0T3_9ACTN
MPTSVLIVVALSVLLGLLVMVLPTGDAETSGSAEADHVPINAETVAGKKHVDFPQVHWNINHGSGAYLNMVGRLRNLAETSADRIMRDDDAEANVDIANEPDTQSFADIVISSGDTSPTLHAIVRLSDFYVVRFLSNDIPHNFVLNLVSDVPGKEDATDDNWFLGKEGYDALARVVNQSLTAVDLSESSLEESLKDLSIRGSDRTAQARGLLRYIIAITEASRFHPIASRIANGMDNGASVFVTAQQVDLMRIH